MYRPGTSHLAQPKYEPKKGPGKRSKQISYKQWCRCIEWRPCTCGLRGKDGEEAKQDPGYEVNDSDATATASASEEKRGQNASVDAGMDEPCQPFGTI